MIENAHQYQITKSWVDKFTAALSELEEHPNPELHPIMRVAQKEALSSQLEELKSEMAAYEANPPTPPTAPEKKD